MEDFVSYLKTLTATSWMCSMMLVGAGAWIIHAVFDSRLLTIMFAGFFQLGALLLIYVAAKNGVMVAVDPDTNLIVLSTAGMILGLAVLLILMRAVLALAGPGKRQVVRD